MLCTYIGGPLDGETKELSEAHGPVYLVDSDREHVHVYEHDLFDWSRIVRTEEITLAEYHERTKGWGWGKLKSPLPDWIFDD